MKQTSLNFLIGKDKNNAPQPPEKRVQTSTLVNDNPDVTKKVKPTEAEEQKSNIPNPAKLSERKILENLIYKNGTDLRKITDKHYHPIDDAPFEIGQPTPFFFVVNALNEVEQCKGENSKEFMKDIISNVFRSIILLAPQELYVAFYFCTTRIDADYLQLDLGIGNETLGKAAAKVTGRSEKQIRDSLNTIGDLGKVVEMGKGSQKKMDHFFMKNFKPITLTLSYVFSQLSKIATIKGQNSNCEKENIIIGLLNDGKPEEAKYIIRFLQKNIKVGAAEKTFQAGLTRAFVLTPPISSKLEANNLKRIIDARIKLSKDEIEKKLEHLDSVFLKCINQHPNHKDLIDQLFIVGDEYNQLLTACPLSPLVPCKPMLAKPTKEIGIIFKRFENCKFTCEYKYDGLRGQIHYSNGQYKIFSRNLEDLTGSYPDIIENLKSSIGSHINSFILDSEIVAVDQKTGHILPFQVLTTRARKNVEIQNIEINVCIYLFDILYFNNESLLQKSLKERREYITKNFPEAPPKLAHAKSKDSESVDEIQEFLLESVKMGCEGLMCKTLVDNSTYEPSIRSFKWLKLKKDYLESGGLADSLDLVPLGADTGEGKRVGVYGSYLVGCYNEDFERYESLCKIGTGFSDEVLQKLFDTLKEHVIPAPSNDYRVKEKVDVWFNPVMVWEVRGADMQISPVHTAGIGEVEKDKGIGLRFPRLIRIRDDKKPTESTKTSQIVEMYKSQTAVARNTNFDEDDFY